MIGKRMFMMLIITGVFTISVTMLGTSSSVSLAQSTPDFTAVAAASTQIVGINDNDLLTGAYQDPAGTVHGFIKDGEKNTIVDVPNAMFVELGMSNNAGALTGDYVAADGIDRPLVRNPDGTLTLKPGFPGASVTFGFGINSRGDIDGSYTLDPMAASGFTGFIMRGNNFITTFTFPGANVVSTFALSMNEAGAIVGSFVTNKPGPVPDEHGFLRSADGRFSQVDFPGSQQTEAFGINAAGDIVGRYQDANGRNHGYLLRGGRFTSFDSALPHTLAWGINNQGTIVGWSAAAGAFEGPFIGFKLAGVR